MKATIKRPDGTVIEAEGSAEEIAKLAGGTTNAPAPHVCAPCQLQHFPNFPLSPAVPPPGGVRFTPGLPVWRPYVGDWPPSGTGTGTVVVGGVAAGAGVPQVQSWVTSNATT